MMRRILLAAIISALALPAALNAQVTVSGSTGANGSYSTLGAAFSAINGTAQTGNNILITITANTTETSSATLNAGAWATVKIYPTTSGLTIGGNINGSMIYFNGSDNVTIDGRVNRTGTTKSLTIANSSTGTSASAIEYNTSADSDSLKYCTIKGSGTGSTKGIISIGDAAASTDGNDYITIANNDITANGTSRPYYAIYSEASKSKITNSGINILDNNFYDFLNKGVASYGLYLGNYNSAWTISGNSFYETSSFTPTASVAYYLIRINSGEGYTISGNWFGGSSASCGGTWTKTNEYDNSFYGLYMNAGTGSASTIQDNSIKNFSWANSSSAPWTGIYIAAGNVNISGNTIGSLAFTTTTGTVNAIYYLGSTSPANTINANFIYGLSITATGNANLYGILIAGGASTYSNNIISLGNNSTQTIYGIYEPGGTNSLYFNTVYIGGSPASGAYDSYALYNNANTGTRNFRNNLLVNARSNNGATGKHYAVRLAGTTTLTINKNDYYAPGTGGILGFLTTDRSTLSAWQSATGQDVSSLDISPAFASAGGTNATDYIPSANTILAAVGTGVTSDYAGTTRSTAKPSMGAYEITVVSLVDVYKSSVIQGGYVSLRDAFDAINNGIHNTGDFEIRITASTTETASAVLNASGSGSAVYSSVTVYPTASGVSVSGNLAAPLISLNGADNVVIDGRVNATGSTRDLIISNTSTSSTAGTSTIRFINDATSNTVRYCNIRGSSTDASAGIIYFSTASLTGNDGNTLDNNNITASADANRPLNAIYSLGTAGDENSGVTVSNNSIYNFLSRGTASFGINLGANTTDWTITGNSFYETASFAPSASVEYILLNINNTSGVNFDVSNNWFGGKAVQCGGTAWTKTNEYDNLFTAIRINAGTATASSVQNNIIRNFDWSNSGAADWTGISIAAGAVNAGTGTGNTVGASTGTGSVLFTAGSSGAVFYGISISSAGNVDCQKSTIGAVTVTNSSANATNFYGIYKSASAGTTNISNNVVGSASTASSVNAASASSSNSQVVYGIYSAGTGTITINGNTVANLVNGTTNSDGSARGLINGIASLNGTLTLSDNTIRDLTIANANNVASNLSSVTGLLLNGTGSAKTVSGNLIYNLSNTNSSFAGSIIGMYYNGSTGTNAVRQNFIHSLSVSSSSTSASIYGLFIFGGITYFSNNLIFIGGNTQSTLYGIYDTGTSGQTCYLYYNTSYVGGSPAAGALNSYSMYGNGTNTRNLRNNIFNNDRSNSGTATGKHYAIRQAANTNLTINYNSYYAPNTGGVIGYLGADRTTLAAWRTASGGDANSLNQTPVFTNPGSTTALDYMINVAHNGIDITGYEYDYNFRTRPVTNPSMGAWEWNINKWSGASSTSWNQTSNWTGGRVPVTNSSIVFSDTPSNNLVLTGAQTITDYVNTQSTYKLVLNGRVLTMKGDIILSNGAQIDASASSSGLTLTGTSPQIIPSGAFASNTAFNITVSNTAGVTLGSDLTLTGTLTINASTSFSIAPGKTLSATSGTITNNAGTSGLVLKSDATGDAKVISSSNTISATVELFLTGGVSGSGARYHYIVPPVQSATLGTSIADVKTNLSLTSFNGDLMLYDESKATTSKERGWQYFDGWNSTTAFSSMVPSRGYNLYLTADDKLVYKGTLNGSVSTYNLSYTSTYSHQGWNLVGNPYPSNYDLTGVTVLNNSDNVDNTVYYTKDGVVYYWNVFTNAGSTGYSDIVPPMQGFFIKVRSAGNTFNLPTAYKSSSAGDSRSKGAADEYYDKSSYISKIKLLISNGVKQDETIACLIPDATMGFDGDYDAEKLFGSDNTQPYIYSVLSGLKYAINCFPGPESSPVSIPLTVVIKTAGTYTITVPEFENMENVKVFLKHGTTETRLWSGASYSFTTGAGTFTDFQLIFTTMPVGTEEPKVTQEEAIKIWYSGGQLGVSTPEALQAYSGKLMIFDMQGRLVVNNPSFALEPGQAVREAILLKEGLYIVKISAGGKEATAKIIIY